MKGKHSNRTRIIGLRLTPVEYEEIHRKWKASTCRKLSEYARRALFERPIVTTYRNATQDDLMTQLSRLRVELNAIGNNLNQAVKRLNALNQIAEFAGWANAYKEHTDALEMMLKDIRANTKNLLDKWLQ